MNARGEEQVRLPNHSPRSRFGAPILARALAALPKDFLWALELEYRFHRTVIHAGGAYVMDRLAVGARFFKAIGERSAVRLDQLVAFTLANFLFKLANGFFKLSYAGFERAFAIGCKRHLLLHLQAERTSHDEFCIEVLRSRGDLRFISKLNRRFVEVGGSADAGHDGHEVHADSPVVKNSNVKTSQEVCE